MKLSELTYEYLESVGLSRVSMHTDSTDILTTISSQRELERAKAELADWYGDVELSIDPEADWFDRILIEDSRWEADHEQFCKEKAAWCSKYGCD